MVHTIQAGGIGAGATGKEETYVEVRDVRVLAGERSHVTVGDRTTVGVDIDLVAQHYEGERLGVRRTGLAQELLAPVLQLLEAALAGDVVHQHTCIRAWYACLRVHNSDGEVRDGYGCMSTAHTHLGKMPHPTTGSAPGQRCPRFAE